MKKRCFKCGKVKTIDNFYAHSAMADGHLNKCKPCACLDANIRRQINLTDPEWVKHEAERCRLKMANYRARGLDKKSSFETRKKWYLNNRHKKRAQQIADRAEKKGRLANPGRCERCRMVVRRLQKHHVDYSKPLEVQWLCSRCHGLTWRKHQI